MMLLAIGLGTNRAIARKCGQETTNGAFSCGRRRLSVMLRWCGVGDPRTTGFLFLSNPMKKVWAVACLVGVVLGLVAYFMSGSRPIKESAVYVIQMQGPNRPAYFLDLTREVKMTDDISKAKRFNKKDGDVWFTAIQQRMAEKHELPAVRKAVKLVGVE
jgi:hypothetical protein